MNLDLRELRKGEVASEEQGRIRMRMENTKSELCTDLREMAQAYERTLMMFLPEHYGLHDVCG